MSYKYTMLGIEGRGAQKLSHGELGSVGPALTGAVNSAVLTVRDLAHEFQTGAGTSLPVINGMSVTVRPGETIAIVGPSGSGKTTFLNLIAGRLRPTRGTIRFNGRADPVAAKPGYLGIVFQQPSLLPWRTVSENVSLPLELIGQAEDASSSITATLEQVGLTGFEDYLPSQVSGGMQSRAALARALITAPQLLLMDEPFGALDEMTAETLNVVLRDILHERAVTTLVVTHQLTQAVFLADRVWVFSARPARLVEDIRINIAAPRRLEVMDSDRFHALVRKVRSTMRTL
jgi:NitT/TauT family transport system ATP-binding protein